MPLANTRRRELLLFPCNGNAREALDCLDDTWQCIGFVDDDVDKHGSHVLGFPVMPRAAFDEHRDAGVLAVPGSSASYQSRRAVIDSLPVSADRFVTVIHPNANVSTHAVIGRNSLIMAGVVITAGAQVGSHCCILPNSVIHHDSQIGNWTLIGAGVMIAGGVSIGENAYLGSGVRVRDGRQVGAGTLIGMGSNVVNSLPAGVRVAGNPARLLDQ